MKARYLLCPGYIFSKNDSDRHFISAGQLKSLYGVNWIDCDIYRPGININRFKYIRLFPRHDGDYKQLPSLEEIERLLNE